VTSEKVVGDDRVPSSGRRVVLCAVIGTAIAGLCLSVSGLDWSMLAGFGVATILATLPMLAWRRRAPFRILCLVASTTLTILAVVGFAFGLGPLVFMAVLLAIAPFTQVRTPG
jgi:hypothetical protein